MPGACEGDLLSTMTMLAITYLVGRSGFISDPVLDTSKNRIIYAHCVAPSKVFGPQGPSNAFHIRSHSEDRKGAAIRSLMPLGYLEQQRKVADLNDQVIKVRQFFALGATLSEEIQTAQGFARSRASLRGMEPGSPRARSEQNEHLQKLEAELHALWPKLVSDLHECAMRRSRDWQELKPERR